MSRPEPFRLPDQLHLCGLCGAVFEGDALSQTLQILFFWVSFHLHPIAFGHFVLGICNFCLKRPFVGEKQKTFAVLIQTTGCVKLRLVDKLCERPGPIRIGKLG